MSVILKCNANNITFIQYINYDMKLNKHRMKLKYDNYAI